MQEVIVKYSGNLEEALQGLNLIIEILSNNYAIITIDKNNIDDLYTYNEIEFIEMPKNLTVTETVSNADVINEICANSYSLANLDGEGTIIAILDSGVDSSHREFFFEDKTSKIIEIWDMESEPINPPAPFKIGSIVTSSTDEVGHGTAVASIAAGSTIGVSKNASLLVVKMPRVTSTTHLMRGISYSINKARELKMPIVVNISFGTNNGSHDGFSLFERFIDDMSYEWKNSIVVAMGNEGDTGRHYESKIETGQTIDVEFYVSENIEELNLRLWKDFVDDFSIEVYSPKGALADNAFVENILPNYLSTAEAVYISIKRPLTGTWRLRVFGTKIIVGTFHIWLPISERIEAYFLEPSTSTTLTIPATAFGVISVGAYNFMLSTYATFSGRGYTRIFDNIKPDIAAPGVSIYSATPGPGGGYGTKTGTSFAAPFVSGAASLLMQWGVVNGNDSSLYGQRIKAYIRKGAKRVDSTYPNNQFGYGRLCIANSISLLESSTSTVKAASLNVTPNEIITSEDYVEFIVKVNNYVLDFVNNNENVFLTTLLTEYGIVYMPKELAPVFENSKIILEYPKNLGLMGRGDLEAANIVTVQNHPYLELRGNGTLTAIIDTGIDYLNDSFVYEDNSSKIEYLWDQTLEGTPPEGFLYGREFTGEEITNAVREGTNLGTTDNIGHGSNLAAAAAGREVPGTNKIGAAPDSSLIIVKLREAKNNVKDLTGISRDSISYASSDLMAATEYVRRQALLLKKPVSICIGMGTNEGSHDGLSLFESFLTDTALKNGVVIQSSIGNEGRARTHFKGKLSETGDSRDIEFRIGEEKAGVSLFLYANEPDKVSVNVTSPTGELVEAIPTRGDTFYETTLFLEKSTVGVRYDFASEKTAAEGVFIRIDKPTPGLWTLTVKGDLIIDGTFNVWLPITNFISSDTYFLEPTAEYTGVIPSTAEGVISVGGYDAPSNILYVNTSRGPTRLGLHQPSIVAPSVNVLGVNPFTGTSAGCAITTGANALLLEWAMLEGNYVIFNSARARNYLTAGATRRDNIIYPNNQWGYGTLNLFGTFEAMRTH